VVMGLDPISQTGREKLVEVHAQHIAKLLWVKTRSRADQEVTPDVEGSLSPHAWVPVKGWIMSARSIRRLPSRS
jgi:hypothetical protein